MQGDITFSTPQEVSVVSAGFYLSRHVTSRRCFRHRIDRHHRGTSRWVPGNQASRSVFMDICRTRFTLTDSTRSPRNFPTVLTVMHPCHFTSHGFHWESLNYRHEAQVLETHVDGYLRTTFTSELTNVALTWSRCVCGVMGHTPLSHPFSKWEDRYELDFLGYLS